MESIVRGYITGSAWESYKKTGEVNGEKLKEGLKESEMLETAIWTPSTKAEVGGKDENISREEGECGVLTSRRHGGGTKLCGAIR